MANIKHFSYSKLAPFLATLLLQTTFAFAQKNPVLQGAKPITSTEVHLPKDLPKLIKELAENFPFEISYLSNATGISFSLINESVEKSFYKSDAAAKLADGARIENVSWHMKKRMNKIEAEFRVNGSCVTHQAIAEQLGGITLMSLPGNPFNFTNPTSRGDFIYARKIDGGLTTITFDEENHCVSRFEFHTPVSKYELKKLQEADTRTPEEIQKKTAPKP